MIYRLLIFLMLMTFGATVNVFGQRPPEMNIKAHRRFDVARNGAVKPK